MTDDTVLEEHSEDPSLLQMRLLGDGGMLIFDILCISTFVRVTFGKNETI